MEKRFGKKYFADGEWISTDVSLPYFEEEPVYEVIRARDGVLMFFDQHFDRLVASCEKKGIDLKYSEEEIRDLLEKLLEVNNEKNYNTKLLVSGDSEHFCCFLSLSIFPTEEMFEEGVKAVSLEIERPDPNLKILRSDYKRRVQEELDRTGAWEVVITDQEGYANEGGKSNLFVIEGDHLVTTPSEFVLKGIIRNAVYEMAKDLNIPILERRMKLEEVLHSDGAFFTGTGTDLLPIAELDGKPLHTTDSEIMRSLLEEYEARIEKQKEWRR